MRAPALFRLALLAAAALLVPGRAAAQQGTCLLVYQNGPWTSVGDPASRVIAADGPLLVQCSGGEELRADSAVIYQNINEVHLFGQVDFQDPTRALTSDRATYSSATGRLYATGNVVFTDKVRGSTLRGPELEYFRAMPDRPEPQSIAPGRPHLTITPKPRDGKRREPLEIDGDRITTVGERHMTAEGNVVIVGEEARSTANTAYYDATDERLELRGNANVDGKDYDLSGEFIESRLTEGALSGVVARENARLVSERLTATGPQLQLFFERDLLQRMVSSNVSGPGGATGRSVALAKGFRMEADSIEAVSPEQKLRQVIAVGNAEGVSWDTVPPARPVQADSAAGDSARPAPAPVRTVALVTQPPEEMTEKDVLLADTIVGYFRQDTAAADSARPAAARDTARRDTAATELERLVATGNARSLYRMRDDSVKAGTKRPGLNYLIGDQIDLTFDGGEVDVANVRGLKKGVYLDPAAPGQNARADSTGAAGAGNVEAPGRTTTGSARPGTSAPSTPRPSGAGRAASPALPKTGRPAGSQRPPTP
ncbi:MAG TPA: LptA/OstA family protein [Longimicrobium sp.]|nr:LptA/OstA family protein [Longimicrobium sp.]